MIDQLLKSGLGQQLISGTGEKLGLDSGTTTQVMSMALPLLLSAMDKNSNTTAGAQSLNKALETKHNGDILSDITGFLSQGDFSDGAGILSHVLGGSQGNIVNQLSQKTGMDAGNIGQLLSMAAPVVMGMLGKEKQSRGLDATGVASLLSNLSGANQAANPSQMGFLEQLLDQNNDGSVVDDVANIGMKLLGSFFSK